MTIEQQALALVNNVNGTCYTHLAHAYEYEVLKALRAALERHEAFRQEVSEAVKDAETEFKLHGDRAIARVLEALSRFIIAPPVDPIQAAITEAQAGVYFLADSELAEHFTEVFARHGLAITKEAVS